MATSARMSIIALLCSIILSCLLPSVSGFHVAFAMAPLVMLFYNASIAICLWSALLSGLALDAIELTPKFGFLGLSYLLTSRLLYPARLYFFKDSHSTLPIMTFLFSFIAGFIEVLVALFFDISLPKCGPLDLLAQPLVDAFFAIIVFMLPSFIWHQYRQRVSRRRYSDDT